MAFNNDSNNMPGLGDEFFDFDAASIDTTWFQNDNSNKNMVSQALPAQSYNSTSVMPLTQTEIDVIVAMRNNKAAAQEKYERENPFAFGMPAPNYNNEEIPTMDTTDWFGNAANAEQTASSPIVAPSLTVVTPNAMDQSE